MNAWSVEERLLPAVAITRGLRQRFFGYYDKPQFDATGRHALGLACDFTGRLQRPDDAATLGMVDLAGGNAWIPLATTRAWNWQMGCLAQWLPGGGARIIYNDRRRDGLVSVVRDIATGAERALPLPVFCVAPDGKTALALNFARLWSVRPETGFCGVADPWADDPAPDEDGLDRMGLADGSARRIISQRDMAPFRDAHDPGDRWYFTHPAYNADGSRILFWYRCRREAGGLDSSAFTANPDGTDLRLLVRRNSHTVWLGSRQVLAWAHPPGLSPGLYLCTDGTDECELVGEGVLTGNGHAVYSPDGEWLLTDLPPDERDHRALLVCNPATGRSFVIGRFHAAPELRGPLRCDLHARWTPDGRAVCLDSTHEGGRQMYLVDVRDIVDAQGEP